MHEPRGQLKLHIRYGVHTVRTDQLCYNFLHCSDASSLADIVPNACE